MKKLIFLLFCVANIYAQPKNVEIEIIKQEISRYQKNVDMDSILVNKKVLPYEKGFLENFRVQADRIGMTQNEIEEIFGRGDEQPYKTCKARNWSKKSFENLKVIFYNGNDNAKNVRGKLRYQIGISKVLLRKDKKFAIVQLESMYTGWVVNIYKYTDQGWVFYKSVTLGYS
ncbi:MAG TPA: hypothetical protein VK623_09935 [Flavobacterium sp.]|nr:hypothetical protein [Flavobacterium sp.]